MVLFQNPIYVAAVLALLVLLAMYAESCLAGHRIYCYPGQFGTPPIRLQQYPLVRRDLFLFGADCYFLLNAWG